MNDDEKDLFIKQELKKDELISKKADDLFNNFLLNKESFEPPKVKVVELNKSKKINWQKRLLSAVASLMVIFLAANGYAATRGYNNIFFIIKNVFTPTEEVVVGKEEILSDRDITISYNMIKIANDVNIQISRLIVNEEKAILTATFAVDGNAKNYPTEVIVSDITNSNKKVLANYSIITEKTDYANQFTENIDLNGFSNDTNNLKVEVYSDNICVTELEILLNEKEINVMSITEEKPEKLSEVDLKEFLSKITKINFYYDNNKLGDYTKEERINDVLLQRALEELGKSASKGKVHKCIKELTGITVEDVIETANTLTQYDSETEKYELNYEKDKEYVNALCLQINDVSFSNGIYTINYIYCYPENANNGDIEQLDQFEAVAKMRLNKQYDYSRYCLINIYDMESKKLEKNDKVNFGNVINNNTTTNTVATNVILTNTSSSSVSNKVNNNIVSNRIINNTASNVISNSTAVTNRVNNIISNPSSKIVSTTNIGKVVELTNKTQFYIDELRFNSEENNAILSVRFRWTELVPQNKRVTNVSISYEDTILGATGVGYPVETNAEYISKEFKFPLITPNVKKMTFSVRCEDGLISVFEINFPSQSLNITYSNDLLSVTDADKLEKELKNTASRYILMNYYKDVDGNNSQEAKNEMMLYTAFLLDEDGMYRNFGSESRYTNIGESIVYSIIRGYTGINFDKNTKFTQNFMTKEEGTAGVEASIKYVSGKRYNLEANIIDVEKIVKDDALSEYSITFTYSYNSNPNNKYRATIRLKTYEFDSSNPIAKQFVLYKLKDTNIQSEKIN